MANALQTQQRPTISQFLNSENVQISISNVVSEKDKKRFVSSIVSAVQTTPALQECTHKSILSAALLGEALNLPPSPNLNFFYMVPFKNTKERCTEATFQLGYKGYIQLAIRSGQYASIAAKEIKDGELKSFNPITEEFEFTPIMDPKIRGKKDTIGYYASFKLINGFRKELYWTKEEMEEHALKYSQGYKSDKRNKTAYTFWSKDFDGMAKKTMLRQLISKWGIMSVEMQRAHDADMAVLDDDGTYRYPDNQPDIKADVAADIADNANSIDFEGAIEADAEVVSDGQSEIDMPDFLTGDK